MFTLAEVELWDAEETLRRLTSSLPLGWTVTIGVESGCAVAEILDDKGGRQWVGSSPDLKLLYLDGLGWLMTRSHKTTHPAWRPREREVEFRVPNPISEDPDPLDLDPSEVDAVYRSKR